MNEPILILCDARTGSTLLRLLLDTHPAICSPSELSLGLLCDHLYHAVQATLGQSGADETLDARTARCFAETRRIVDDLFRAYCASKGKRRWCEKTPRNLHQLATLHAVFPDAKHICLYRHCLDAVHSTIWLFGEAPRGLEEYRQKNGGNTVASYIERWCDRTDMLLAFEAQNASASVRVRYEDLVADPAGVLRRILDFLGEAWVPDLVERVFSTPHDMGTGDPKIVGSQRIETDRVGLGRQLDVRGMRQELRDRMRRTLAVLGYDEQIGDPPAAVEAPRREITSVAELFSDYFPRQLERHGSWLASPPHEVGLVVRGPGGGTWTIRFDDAGARFASGRDTPEMTVTLQAADLLDAVNRRLTRMKLSARCEVHGDINVFDFALADRLLEALIGEDFRPAAQPGDVFTG